MSNKAYRVIFTPIEPYFFGEEKNMGFNNYAKPEESSAESNSYFIRSGLLPSQSTIIGTIRYFVLKNNKESKPDEKGFYENNGLVGEKSFDLHGDNSFGMIKKIGPLHLFDGIDEYYRCPRNAKVNKDSKIAFMEMEKVGEFAGHYFVLPNDKEYDSKKGLFNGWMNAGGDCVKDSHIFDSVVKTGILKNGGDDALFKKEYKFLKRDQNDWSFCCLVEVDESVDAFEKTDIVQMGQDKSSFYVKAVKLEEKDINSDSFHEEMKNALKGRIPMGYSMLYAASDVFFESDYSDSVAYAITSLRNFRYMTTDTSKKDNYFDRLKKSSLHYLVNAGSVFFVNDNGDRLKECYSDALSQWGFNDIWTVKGE